MPWGYEYIVASSLEPFAVGQFRGDAPAHSRIPLVKGGRGRGAGSSCATLEPKTTLEPEQGRLLYMGDIYPLVINETLFSRIDLKTRKRLRIKELPVKEQPEDGIEDFPTLYP